MHIPPSVFDSVHFMVTVVLPGSPLFCQKHNHKKLPKTLSSQRQTTDKNGKEELLCEDWVHGCSFFPLLQGIMYLPASWKPGVMMLKLPLPHFSMFILIELGKGKWRRKKLHGANSYLLFKA